MTQRDQLIARIKRQKEAVSEPTKPVVSLEEFFEGNEDYGSIGCNLDMPYREPPPPDTRGWLRRILRPELVRPVPTAPHPGPQGFYKVLRAVRERADVQDVLVEIEEFDEADGRFWPFSEVVYILTKAPMQDVEAWVAALFPDEIREGYFGDKPSLVPDLLPGYWVYAAWWD